MVDAIGIDIGGTNVRVAEVAADGTVGEVRRAPTPNGDAEALAATVADLHGGRAGVTGIGIAGGITADGVLCGAPNLGMDGAPVGRLVRDRLEGPIVIANDASAATWAEHRVGGARGVDDVVMLTLGTGVGGGAVVAGRLLCGAHGLASEFGHIVLVEGGAHCACGNQGCLEAYASGTAMGMGERNASDVAAAAAAGDDIATAHLTRVGTWIGIGLASLVNALDPALVVLGGGAGSATYHHVVPSARAALAERLFARAGREPPPIERALLGDDAGVVGAALLAIDEVGR